jgi:hypothetical protein
MAPPRRTTVGGRPAVARPILARWGRRSLATVSAVAVGGLTALAVQTGGQTVTAAPTGAAAHDGRAAVTVSTVAAARKSAHRRQVQQGRQIFRHDTFGDQAFWGGTLDLDRAIAGSRNGGVGPGVSPKTALAVGLKVDATALPAAVKKGIAAGKVDLDDPAVTLALLKLRAVVGVKGFFNRNGSLRTVGIECALCHSTVDNSFAPGIGKRLDGWANRDLNVGAIVGLSPNLTPVARILHTDVPTVQKVLGSWGPGKFDAELFLDGKAFQPDGRSAATLIPPAFGLLGVNLSTNTGFGSLTYWNAFVANLEMHGKGNFHDTRLDNAAQFPIAAENRLGHTTTTTDKITPKLAALAAYEYSLTAPKPRKGSMTASAKRGRALFNGSAQCSTCHVPPLFTEPGYNLHPGADIGIDSFESDRSPTHMYRTSPLAGLRTHRTGGFYHDGRFPTLSSVVRHYDKTFGLKLTKAQRDDLVHYLMAL